MQPVLSIKAPFWEAAVCSSLQPRVHPPTPAVGGCELWMEGLAGLVNQRAPVKGAGRELPERK